MRFHICNIERKGYAYGHFLDDACRLFSYAIESLGHACSMSCNQIEPDRINIIFGGHMLNSAEDVNAIASSCRYIALQHEVLNPSGVNLSGDSAHFQHVYLPLLRRAMIVWEGMPSNCAMLNTLGVRYGLFLGGYHERLEEIRPSTETDIDFLFYGSITPYRRVMLEKLAARGNRVVAVFDPRAAYRNNLISRSKVQLAPIQGPSMNHFAYGRVCYLINNRTLVIAQQCRDQQWLDSCFISASEEEWVAKCEHTLHRPDRDMLREEHYEKFKQLPFNREMRKLLEATFSTSCGPDTGIIATDVSPAPANIDMS